MLTIDIKRNGAVIASADLVNRSGLADQSTYDLRWNEEACADLGIAATQGRATIHGHRRRQTVWALVAKAVVIILDKMAGDPRGIR